MAEEKKLNSFNLIILKKEEVEGRRNRKVEGIAENVGTGNAMTL